MGDASISRHLSHEFVRNWQRHHPDGQVITRDVGVDPPALITAEWVGASFTPAAALTPRQREVLATSDAIVAELEAADEYVIGVPMHNFTITAALRLWIDQIARAHRTFAFVDGGAVGLLKDKKATLLIAAGGVYGPGSARASYNFVEPYLRTVLSFIGVADVKTHAAYGASAVNHGKIDLQAFLHPHLEAVRALFPAA